MSSQPPLLSIKSIFEKEIQYSIPIYQREYAWDVTQISQLLSDICSQAKVQESNKNKENYYLGTLVVHSHNGLEYIIDGQQRLTTLYILLAHLSLIEESSYKLNFNYDTLSFDSRPKSINSLKTLHNFRDAKNIEISKIEESAIRSAYEIIMAELTQQCDEFDISIQEFTDYLLSKTKLLKVTVPPDTDLNHYFEIMNVRGEQLEKHEVLKSRLMSNLDNELDRVLFATVWAAASDMNKYIQLFFKRDISSVDNNIRQKIFGNDGNHIPSGYNDLKSKFQLNNFKTQSVNYDIDDFDKTDIDQNSLDYILSQSVKIESIEYEQPQDDQDQLTAVINFPNFLLHVLKIMQGDRELAENEKRVALDDKQLLQQFNDYLKDYSGLEKVQFSKDFCYALFKAKFLFDNYIIRNLNDGSSTEWVLRKQVHQFAHGKSYHLKNTFDSDNNLNDKAEIKDQARVVMLQSMFHVSFPTRIYKHWFNGTLRFLMNKWDKGHIKSNDFINALEEMNDAFFFDRNQDKEDNLDYDVIIYNKGGKKTHNSVDDSIWWAGTKTKNFTFNRLEYLLWYFTQVKNELHKLDNLKDKVSSFSFGFRSSVEHFYPQQPRNGKSAVYNIDRFGNLCLLSQQQNSRYSNDLPSAKKANYHRPNESIESLKMELMWGDAENWGDENIVKKHEEQMKSLMLQKLERNKYY